MVISWSTGNAVILDEAPSNSSLPDIGSAVCCTFIPKKDLLTAAVQQSAHYQTLGIDITTQ